MQININRQLIVFYKMGTQEGISSYYRGVLARMGRVVPGQGILFMTADQIAQQLEKVMTKPQLDGRQAL